MITFLRFNGEVSERLKVLDSKSSVVTSHRGFESHPLRHFENNSSAEILLQSFFDKKIF